MNSRTGKGGLEIWSKEARGRINIRGLEAFLREQCAEMGLSATVNLELERGKDVGAEIFNGGQK